MQVTLTSDSAHVVKGAPTIVTPFAPNDKKRKKLRRKTENIPAIIIDGMGSNTIWYPVPEQPTVNPVYREQLEIAYDEWVARGLGVARNHDTLALFSHTHPDHTRHFSELRSASRYTVTGYDNVLQEGQWGRGDHELSVRAHMSGHGSTSGEYQGTTSMFRISDGDNVFVHGMDFDWRDHESSGDISEDARKFVKWNPDAATIDGPHMHAFYQMCGDATKFDKYMEPSSLKRIMRRHERLMEEAEDASDEERRVKEKIAFTAARNVSDSIDNIEYMIRNTDCTTWMIDHHVTRRGRGRGLIDYLGRVAKERSFDLDRKIRLGSVADLMPSPVLDYKDIVGKRSENNVKIGRRLHTEPLSFEVNKPIK